MNKSLSLTKRLLHSRGFFWVALAALMVASRLIIFDFGQFFLLKYVPNHDIYQGAPFFTTSMNTMRQTGDIVWWNPASYNGYAQYYQSFTGPFAPTPSHIVFIVWAQMIRLLSFVGIALPEYYQFLTVNYIVLPFLTFVALGMFLSQLYRRRAPVIAVMIGYTFSSLGIWNGAWAYFQESFTLFLLLAAFIGYLRTPTPKNLAFLALAGLIQLTSFNYWTVFNFWFILLVVGGYIVVYPHQVRRAWVRTRDILRRHPRPAAILAGLVTITALTWMVLIGSIVWEQADRYQRDQEDDNVVVEEEDFIESAPFDARKVANMLNPDPYRNWSKPYHTYHLLHTIPYIGLYFVPFLVLLPFFRWGRREKWALMVALGTLAISVATPLFVFLWETLPFVQRIRHYAEFYPGYFRFMLMILAGGVLDYLLQGRFKPAELQRFGLILGGLCGLAGFSLILSSVNITRFVTIGLYTLIPAVLVLQMLRTGQARPRQLLLVALLIFGFADMSRYFWVVSHVDADFTRQRWDKVARPLPRDIQDQLRSLWPDASPDQDLEAFFEFMPIRNHLWLKSSYMSNNYLLEIPVEYWAKFITNRREFLTFYPQSIVVYEDDPAEIDRMAVEESETYWQRLVVEKAGTPPESSTPTPNGVYSFEWGDWLYDTFNFTATIPEDGWLQIRQLYDPVWELTVDGKKVELTRANIVTMAFPIQAGEHTIHLEYRPLARKLYWPASFLLEATLLGLLGVMFRNGSLKRAA